MILEIALTSTHTLIVGRPHCQELGMNILFTLPLLNEDGRNLLNIQT